MDESLRNFTGALASAAPTPGGGGAAALMGSLAASLGAMASRLSAGRKAAAENAEELGGITAACEELRLRFLEQIEADAAAFLPLVAAYKLPKEQPDRAEILRKASLGACSAAAALLCLCSRTTALLRRLRDIAGPLLQSDVGCAAAACRAALLSAAYNIYVNIRPYPEESEAQGLERTAEAVLQESLPLLEEIEMRVLMDLRNEEP